MIEFIFSTVCLALGEKYVSWKDTGRKMIKDLNKFIERLIKKIKDIKQNGGSVISTQTLKNLEKNLQNEFLSEKKLNTNIIAKPLGNWCIAIYDFTFLKKQVEPLEIEVQQMQQKLDKATKEYNLVSKDLKKCNNEFQNLQDDFDKMQKKQKKLQDSIKNSQIKLVRAEKLTSLLTDEKKRWTQSIEQLTQDLNKLTGDIFISSSFISYIGPLSLVYRQQLKKKWIQIFQESKKISFTKNYSFLQIMGDPIILQNWTLQGLPSDEISLSSGIITTKSLKYPFLIDPQLQAIVWLKNLYKNDDNFIVLKSTESSRRFNQVIKQSLQNGYQILLEECKEKIPQQFEPILNKQQFFNSLDQQMMINIGEDSIFFNKNFKLFLITQYSNPNFQPNIFIKTNVINFTVTKKGLEDQLLAEVMKLERPQEEKIRNLNIEKISKFQQNMKELEQKILALLVKCENSPVEDESLVETLQYSKKVAKEITQKISQTEEINQKFLVVRENYRIIAEIGSIIFFVVQQLTKIDPMYQYSLQVIKRLFNTSIIKTKQKGNQRLKMLQNNIIQTIYENIQRGIFVEHKQIFCFLLAINLQLQTGQLNMEKWQLFLKGCGVVDRSKQIQNPDVNLIDQYNWDFLSILDNKFQSFKGIINSIVTNYQLWKKNLTDSDFTFDNLPDNFNKRFKIFDQLLLIKILQPQLLLDYIKYYIQEKLGQNFLNSSQNQQQQIYEESDNKTPIVFILSKGADPSSLVKKIGNHYGFKMYERLIPISLGQGQGERASRLIEIGLIQGHWILLENCHLAKTWMPQLEQQIQNILKQPQNTIHKDFRLFLTSMPAEYFPISILQNSIKFTTEPPKGIRANVRRSFQNIQNKDIQQTYQENIMRKIQIGLCFFHAIIQERRKFGPLGWNIAYEFNNSDIDTANNILRIFLQDIEDKRDIPWDSLQFLTGKITYGGRVTDELDQRLLFCILFKFYNDNILNDYYKFCSIDTYKIPNETNKQIYIKFIDQLPVNDSPEVFGLHPNANITYKSQEVFKIFQTIKIVQSQKNNLFNDNQKNQIKELIYNILSQDSIIKQQLSFKNGNKRHFKKQQNGLIPPLSTVLMQELTRFNILTKKIINTLQNLDQAIQGKITMSTELEKVYDSILQNMVPSSWKIISYPSLKTLSSWFENLKKRLQFISSWLNKDQIDNYWLPGLFFPQGFLTGVLQTHARKTNEPIDQFSFTFKATDYFNNQQEIVKPEDGVLISGLFLEGANWDLKRKGIVDSIPGKLFVEMPMIHFLPKRVIEKKGNLYSCPLYKTQDRAGSLSTTGQSTNFILMVNIPCDKTSDVWIMKGVALFCELRD